MAASVGVGLSITLARGGASAVTGGSRSGPPDNALFRRGQTLSWRGQVLTWR